MTQLDSKSSQNSVDFHGAAIIDEQGREIPITESMVQKACKQLQEKKSAEKSQH